MDTRGLPISITTTTLQRVTDAIRSFSGEEREKIKEAINRVSPDEARAALGNIAQELLKLADKATP